jgi:phosphatidylglycerol:prolipoprotein diacylglycerol transferase
LNNFINWWQHLPEQMDPVIFSIGSFSLQYYGLMYLVAFSIVYLLAVHRIRKERDFGLNTEQFQELMIVMILGVLIGGRLGYVLFYNFAYYWRHPLEIIFPFDISDGFRFTGISGMSFHGGLIAVILGSWLYIRKNKLDFPQMVDLVIPCIPLGYTFGRIGNFINGELYGRITDRPIGMFFPQAPGNELRHPSQLYEAFFEGIVLFVVLWLIRTKIKISGAMLSLYLMGYGLVRFFIEYTRQPDDHLGFVLFQLSMGQILCLLMIAAGAGLLIYQKYFRKPAPSPKKTKKGRSGR